MTLAVATVTAAALAAVVASLNSPAGVRARDRVPPRPADADRGPGVGRPDPGREPSALQLRYLQTLLEIGAERSSTIVFPLPINLIKPFLDTAAEGGGARQNGVGDAGASAR